MPGANQDSHPYIDTFYGWVKDIKKMIVQTLTVIKWMYNIFCLIKRCLKKMVLNKTFLLIKDGVMIKQLPLDVISVVSVICQY